MPQDYFTLKHVATELNKLILGAKVQKINMPNDFETVLTVYNGKTLKLIASCEAKFARVGLTIAEKKNPLVAKNFCMLLRKHLLGAKITGVSIASGERIILVDFSNENDLKENVTFTLIVEVMNKYSNVFLTSNGIILGAMRQTPQNLESERITLSGAKYTFPPSQNKLNPYNNSDLLCGFSKFSGGDLGNFILTTFNCFAPVTAEEIAYRILENGAFTIQNAVNTVTNFLNEGLNANYFFNGKSYDYFAINYHSLKGEKQYSETLTSCIDKVILTEQEVKNFLALKNAITSKVTAYEKKQLKRRGKNSPYRRTYNRKLLRDKKRYDRS